MGIRLVLRIVSGPFMDANQLTLSHAKIQGEQSLVVGRSRLCSDLGVRQDMMMSGKHFHVGMDRENQCILNDLKSTNGTFVNGARVQKAILRDEDQILAGQTTFRVLIRGGEAISTTIVEFGVVEIVEPADGPIEEDANGDSIIHSLDGTLHKQE